MNRLFIAILLSAGIQGAGAAGFFFTGRDMLDLCLAAVNDTSTAKANTCIGYVTGMAEAHELLVDEGRGPPRWCMPNGAHTGELAAAVIDYLKAHPDRLQWAAGPLVAGALAAKLPCE